MAEYHIAGTGGGNHGSGYFAGIGATGVVGAVLGAKAEDCGVDGFGYGYKVGEGNAHNHIAVGFGGCDSTVHFFGKGYTFGYCGVHFPVAGNYVLSHLRVCLLGCTFV